MLRIEAPRLRSPALYPTELRARVTSVSLCWPAHGIDPARVSPGDSTSTAKTLITRELLPGSRHSFDGFGLIAIPVAPLIYPPGIEGCGDWSMALTAEVGHTPPVARSRQVSPRDPVPPPGSGGTCHLRGRHTNMMQSPVSATPTRERCPYCQLVGARHGSDRECIAALRLQVAHLAASAASRLKQVA